MVLLGVSHGIHQSVHHNPPRSILVFHFLKFLQEILFCVNDQEFNVGFLKEFFPSFLFKFLLGIHFLRIPSSKIL